MIVKAAVARHSGQPLVIESLMLGEPQADEVLVRLVASGVSRTDLDAIAGGSAVPYPFVPGGEGAGLVEGVGTAVTGLSAGDAVILTMASCGTCPACRSGAPRDCLSRHDLNEGGRRRDGSTPFAGEPINGFFQGQSSFATHALCHYSCAVKVENGAALEVLACLGGSLQASAAALIGQSFDASDVIVITGAEIAGLAAILVAVELGAQTIIVADPSAERRAHASAAGATMTVHTDEDLAAVVKSLTGSGVRYALDTTGNASAIEACQASLSPAGRLITIADAMTPAAVIATLASWHANGRFPLESLITFFAFEHINEALQALATGSVVKPVVRFSIGSFGDLDRADIEGADVSEPEVSEPEPPLDEETDAPVAAVAPN